MARQHPHNSSVPYVLLALLLGAAGCSDSDAGFFYSFGAGEITLDSVPTITYADGTAVEYPFESFLVEVREDGELISPREKTAELTMQGSGPVRGFLEQGTLLVKLHSEPETGRALPAGHYPGVVEPGEAKLLYTATEGDAGASAGTITVETFEFQRLNDEHADVSIVAHFDDVVVGDFNGVPPYSVTGTFSMTGKDRGHTPEGDPFPGGDGAASDDGGPGSDTGADGVGLAGLAGVWVTHYCEQPDGTNLGNPESCPLSTSSRNIEPAFSGFSQHLVTIDAAGNATWCPTYWREVEADRAACFDWSFVELTLTENMTVSAPHTDDIFIASDCVFGEAKPISEMQGSWSRDGEWLTIQASLEGIPDLWLNLTMKKAVPADNGGCTGGDRCQDTFTACQVDL